MIRYIKGLMKLFKIRFAIDNCQDIYFLESALNTFMQAEGKRIIFEKNYKIVVQKPFGKPLIISRLPQYSECIYQQIQKIKEDYNKKIPRANCLKEYDYPIPQIGRFESSFYKKDDIFENNLALYLTYTGYIPETDLCKNNN